MKVKSVELKSAIGAQSNYNSDPVSLAQIAMFASQVVYSASSCTIKLQGSCDKPAANDATLAAASAAVVNWTDIPNTTSSALTGAGSLLLNVPDCAYTWVRFVVTGTATITSAKFAIKGF